MYYWNSKVVKGNYSSNFHQMVNFIGYFFRSVGVITIYYNQNVIIFL